MKNILLLLFSLFLILVASTLLAQEKEKSFNEGEFIPVKVLLKTNYGDIVLSLNQEKAPKTVENFVSYVKSGHYDGTVFHRVIADFMIQGGGMDANLKEKSTQRSIDNEANNGLKNNKYTVAMARTGEPHSATSQFFINTVDNDFLNFKSETPNGWGYAVFAEVTEGQEVVDKIASVETASKGQHDDVPKEDVTILSATIIE